MRASLRGFYSSDVDLVGWRPDDGENFSVEVTAFIGPSESGGEEMFDFHVCTGRWLIEHPPEKNFAFVRSTILMQRWDYQTLHRALEDLCFRTEGTDWKEIAGRLSRYGRWEFEDYRP
jgi:hypothetical protein